MKERAQVHTGVGMSEMALPNRAAGREEVANSLVLAKLAFYMKCILIDSHYISCAKLSRD